METNVNIPKKMLDQIKSQMDEPTSCYLRRNEWIRDAIREKLERDELFYYKLRHNTL